MDAVLSELRAALAPVLATPPWHPLRNVLATPLDVGRWDWSQLDPRNAHEFKWQYGVTPFSNWEVIVAAWIAYFGSILLIRTGIGLARQPFELRGVAAVHNMILVLWSLAMFVFVVVDAAKIASDRGVDALFCTRSTREMTGRLFFGVYVYYLSKFYELLDTVILALKNKPIIFLHWFHHAIVITMVWSWLHYGLVFSSFGMAANTLVHVFMYYFYYKAALQQEVWFKRFITSGQIVQFTVSFLLLVPFFYYHNTIGDCVGFEALVFTMACNGLFLLLFVQFYARTYGGEGKGKKAKKDQ